MNLSSWFDKVINVASVTGRAADGTPTFGAAREVYARVQPYSRVIKGANGTSIACDTQVYTDAVILETDRVWLPGKDPANPRAARKPVSVRASSDKPGDVTLFSVLL